MKTVPDRKTILKCVLIVAVLSLIILPVILPADSPGAAEDETFIETFNEVAYLRSRGEYDQAVTLLQDILKEYGDSEQVLRHAYNQLVYTLKSKPDTDAMMAYARTALERFPDLKIEDVESNIIPRELNEIYDQLRAEMFGSVRINEPAGCRLFLNGEFMGETPIYLPLVRVGGYDLELTKSGYHDLEQRIQVDPSGDHRFELSMQRERDKWWWVYRVGPALVGSAILTYGLVRDSGSDTGANEEPLPEPPAPPSN